MEGVRNIRLNNIFESIAEVRSHRNRLDVEEKSLLASALQVMQRDGVSKYKHAGVEALRVPGSEKLRVRLTKDDGDVSESDGETINSQEDIDGSERIDDAPDDDLVEEATH